MVILQSLLQLGPAVDAASWDGHGVGVAAPTESALP
jgi:hypothetical protein